MLFKTKGKIQIAFSSSTNPFQTLGISPENKDHIFLPIKINILFPQISEAAESVVIREDKYKAGAELCSLKLEVKPSEAGAVLGAAENEECKAVPAAWGAG